MIVTLLLALIGVLIIMIFVSLRSQSASVSTELTITNSAPTIDSLTVAAKTAGGGGYSTISEGANLSISANGNNQLPGTTTLRLHGDYTDNNGCGEISNEHGSSQGHFLAIAVATSRTSTAECRLPRDNKEGECYVVSSSTTLSQYHGSSGGHPVGAKCVVDDVASGSADACSDNADVTASYECFIDIHDFAQDTNTNTSIGWTTWVVAFDGTASSSSSSRGFNIANTPGLDATSTLSFGSVALGGDSVTTTNSTGWANNADANTNASGEATGRVGISNIGNDGRTQVDAVLSSAGGELSCTSGVIEAEQIRFASSSAGNASWFDMTATVATSGDNDPVAYFFRSGFGVNVATASTTQSIEDTYWSVRVPSTGVAGSCSGTITLTAS